MVGLMTTLRECADTAAAALAEMLRGAKGEVDTAAVAEVIENVLNQATSETEEGAQRRLVDLQAPMQERLTRLLDASPAVIYSFKARDYFAPIFVSDNIETLFGYAPRDYLDNPNFWREHVYPEDLSRSRGRDWGSFRQRQTRARIPVSPQGRILLLGQRRAAFDPGREERARRDRRLLERYPRAKEG